VKLAQFKTKQSTAQKLGLLHNERLCDLTALAIASAKTNVTVASWLLDISDTLSVIKRGDSGLEEIKALLSQSNPQTFSFALDEIELLPAIHPGKILAIGRNYIDHAIEGGAEPPKAPLIFDKLPNSLSAHNAPVVLPSISNAVDYEAELAVIIGRRAKRVGEAEALNYVFGYTLMNDVTARDLQYGDGQWTRGKGLDGFAPLGPFITTCDEIADVHNLKIVGRLNNEVMQSSNTGKMIFRVPYLISYISQGITLEPGDVISTGTPDGVGYFRKPPVLLKAGDVFEVEIERLGTLRNPIVAS
jgi:2-keto-4-pentenoate hydratase/2-oxohepta-3-ene-1,7-dioic acid hydratase in catechol pathway